MHGLIISVLRRVGRLFGRLFALLAGVAATGMIGLMFRPLVDSENMGLGLVFFLAVLITCTVAVLLVRRFAPPRPARKGIEDNDLLWIGVGTLLGSIWSFFSETGYDDPSPVIAVPLRVIGSAVVALVLLPLLISLLRTILNIDVTAIWWNLRDYWTVMSRLQKVQAIAYVVVPLTFAIVGGVFFFVAPPGSHDPPSLFTHSGRIFIAALGASLGSFFGVCIVKILALIFKIDPEDPVDSGNPEEPVDTGYRCGKCQKSVEYRPFLFKCPHCGCNLSGQYITKG